MICSTFILRCAIITNEDFSKLINILSNIPSFLLSNMFLVICGGSRT